MAHTYPYTYSYIINLQISKKYYTFAITCYSYRIVIYFLNNNLITNYHGFEEK